MNPTTSRIIGRYTTLLWWLLALGVSAVEAAPYAFVSVSEPGSRAVRVVDIATMQIEAAITNVGDEPSRMVVNADRSRIWLASWRFNGASSAQRGMIYAIDTRLRSVVGMTEVGRRQNRAIAISPDGTRLYSWKETLVGTSQHLAVAVLDAVTLNEFDAVALPASCLNARDLLTHPDGGVYLSGCSDGLRRLDPLSLDVSVVASTPFADRLLGFSPDSAEIYITNAVNVQPPGNSGVFAMDLVTGAANSLLWNLPPGSPLFPTNSRAFRMLAVQRPADPPGQPLHLFTYSASSGDAPVAYALAADLAPPAGPRNRQLIGTVGVGPVEAIGGAAGQSIALGIKGSMAQRIDLAPASGTQPIAALGSPIALPGADTLSDIVYVPYPPDGLFGNGFEQP